ncbi:hypothetical protein BGZ70_001905, partial [Mortierella alpina]
MLVTQDDSWFLRVVKSRHLHDGDWTTTAKVVTTSKAYVDSVCPLAKTAYVYYDDDDVYDSTLTETTSGIAYVTQLIYDRATK